MNNQQNGISSATLENLLK